ncbi:hypothetical protein FACS1894211_08090 [Clostridia bacterium]|nr:hypothetical protein FACS1894211_08090 [Clostridia bacterium]
MKRAAIVLNGDSIPDKIPAPYIVCADGGYNLLRARGITPDLLIGDMDSVGGAALREATDGKIRILKYDAVKNESDGELALLCVAREQFTHIDIYGAFGGRPDHEAANLALLIRARELGLCARICGAACDVYYVNADDGMKCGESGRGVFYKKIPEESSKISDQILVSIVPLIAMTFRDSFGLRYDLSGLTIRPGSGRGISNIATTSEIGFTLLSGSGYVYIIGVAK